MGLFRRIFGKSNATETNIPDAPEQSEPPANATASSADSLDVPTKPLNTVPPMRSVADGVTRPLILPERMYQDDVFAGPSEFLAFGQSSHVGKVRTNNQDSALSFFVSSRSVEDYPDFGLFVVADGMGGHHDGEKASAITTRVIAAQVTNSICLPALAGMDSAQRAPITESLVSAVQHANAEVLKKVPEGGTTVTAVAVIGDLAHVVHVGDSRAYIITKDGLEQITRDHSLVQRLIELDQLTREDAVNHPQKNVLYRALGQNESLEVDALTRRLPPNSRILICSDGLWSQVEERDLYEITMNNSDPQQACEKLVDLANARGGTDNITAIILKMSG